MTSTNENSPQAEPAPLAAGAPPTEEYLKTLAGFINQQMMATLAPQIGSLVSVEKFGDRLQLVEQKLETGDAATVKTKQVQQIWTTPMSYECDVT
jgi:hypothetical protein